MPSFWRTNESGDGRSAWERAPGLSSNNHDIASDFLLDILEGESLGLVASFVDC